MIGLAATGGIGFTMSLLVAELSFPHGSAHRRRKDCDSRSLFWLPLWARAILSLAVTSTTVPWLRRKAWTLTTTGIPVSSRGTYRDPKAEALARTSKVYYLLYTPDSSLIMMSHAPRRRTARARQAPALTPSKVCRDTSTRGDRVFFCRAILTTFAWIISPLRHGRGFTCGKSPLTC